MKHCCWHGICGRKTDREICAFSRKFELDLWENQWIDWNEIISACSTILYALCVKFWKKSDKRLLSNNFWKNRSGGRRGGSRHIWRSIISKFRVTLKLNYSALLERNLMKLKYYVIPDLICTKPRNLRNRGNIGLICSKTVQLVLRKEHLTDSTAPHLKCIYRTREESRNQWASRIVVTWLKRRGLRVLRVRSGHRRTSWANRINAIPEHCKTTLDLCKLVSFLFTKKVARAKIWKILSKRKIVITLNRNYLWINECQQRFGHNFSFMFI